MTLVDINWHPSDRQLRQFGILAAIALPLIGWLWSASAPVLQGLAITGGLIAVAGWWWPAWIRPLFIAAVTVTSPIGWVIGELMVGCIYWLVFVPLGLWFRLRGRDALRLHSQQRESYWQPVGPPREAASYYRQS